MIDQRESLPRVSSVRAFLTVVKILTTKSDHNGIRFGRTRAEMTMKKAQASAGIGALEAEGMEVTVVARAGTFARLLVTHPDGGGEPDKVEVAADWRSHEPVTLEIGPVLHADDAVANKMAALYGRALARDFLDIDAILSSGRYSRERLLDLAAAAD